MAYRDDLLNQLRESGIWEKLPRERQRQFEELTDDAARQLMVTMDDAQMGDPKTIEGLVHLGIEKVAKLFGGLLVDPSAPGRLSRAGTLLAEFVSELRSRNVSDDLFYSGLDSLDPVCVAALLTIHRGPSST